MSRRQSNKKKPKNQKETSFVLPDSLAWLGSGPLRTALALLVVVVVAIYGLERLKQQVYSQDEYNPKVKLQLADRDQHEWIEKEGWRERILSSIELPPNVRWRDEHLLQQIAHQTENSGWIADVQQATKYMDGTVKLECEYRRPIAMIYTRTGLRSPRLEDGFIPVDKHGVRLPEEYSQVQPDSGWMRVFGVHNPPPDVGEAYPAGTDAQAAVRLAKLLFQQEYAYRISAIDMTNFRGRRDRGREHIVLRTRSGGQIVWGSAIGEECEELPPTEKLRNIALFMKRGKPQAHVQVNLRRNGWIRLDPEVTRTADSAR